MDNNIIDMLLDRVRQQQYPLEISFHDADALVCCINRIMDAVPEDDRVFVRADYNAAMTALVHPNPTSGLCGE